MAFYPWEVRITTDPSVCHVKPCFRKTQIMVSIVLDYLGAGESAEAVTEQYPSLTHEDIRAAMAHAV